MVNRFRPEQFLTLESQFCSLCFARNNRVRVIHVGHVMSELRQGRSEEAALRAYRARRKRAIVKHLAEFHPEVSLK